MEALIGSQAAYGRHAGISRQMVGKLVRAGTIILTDAKKVDFAQADHARNVNADPARTLPAAVEVPAAGLVPAEPKKPAEDSATQNYTDHRAQREFYNSRMAQLEYEEKSGLVVRIKDVEDAMVAAGRKLRQQSEGLIKYAEEIDAAARNNGVDGVRAILRKAVNDYNTGIAESIRLMGEENGEDDSD